MTEQKFSWQIEAILYRRVLHANMSYCILMGTYDGRKSLAAAPLPKGDPDSVLKTLYVMDSLRKEKGGELLTLFFGEADGCKTIYSFHLSYDKVGSIRQDKTEELCDLLLDCNRKEFEEHITDAVPTSVPFGYVVFVD